MQRTIKSRNPKNKGFRILFNVSSQIVSHGSPLPLEFRKRQVRGLRSRLFLSLCHKESAFVQRILAALRTNYIIRTPVVFFFYCSPICRQCVKAAFCSRKNIHGMLLIFATNTGLQVETFSSLHSPHSTPHKLLPGYCFLLIFSGK